MTIIEKENDILLHPWLSVIIPIYNAEKYIKICVNSILKQSFKDFELLLIDDGSTDMSPTICNEFTQRDKRVRYFRKENGGTFHTRIFGAAKAQGEYILFCDADDHYANKNVFSIIYKEAINNKCSVIQFGHWKKYNHVYRKIRVTKNKKLIYKIDFKMKEYPKLMCSFWRESHLTMCVWDKLYHHTLLNNLPDLNKVERVFWGEDLILNLFLLKKCDSCLLLTDSLYVYNDLSGGTNKFSMHTMEDLNIIKKYQLLFLERWKGEKKSEVENNLYAEIAGWFFVFVQQALEMVDEDKLKLIIQDTLGLPSFILAKNYFIENSNEKWEAAELLREANPDKYIKAAKYHINNVGLKSRIICFAKKIVKTI